jgi:hypothetical protein
MPELIAGGITAIGKEGRIELDEYAELEDGVADDLFQVIWIR